ncbi:unnamed protein product [Pelagomonas calceolata]|uniref:Uncharacterized protein n=1 Tax=Pelagomonas calceolata TaxID=35677 RepID=A0A7S4A439_9STRA|nr:unnamed protein product [Pelagomonas calceolata]|mmetsp:Transcript_24447/g.74533  ORF Transcript_24447/g.74533 Transcript_24447/m.74533 type:complete len:331 (+) Transcript_24447:63-1055(+)
MMLRAATQRLSIPVAQGAPQCRLLSTALPPPQRRVLSRGVFARGAAPSSSALQSQRRLLSSETNALSHYKRKRLLEKIGFGIHNSRRDARRLRLGALRSLASPRTRTTHLTVLHRAYGVLEACLDAQVAALDRAPTAEGELEDFSSLQGVAAQFWQEHGDGLRRAPALAAALKADRPEIVELGEEPDAEEHYWSPGTVQFARRVRAVDALNGDLLLGHILGAHVGELAFEASIGFSADERRLGFTPSRNPAAPPVSEVLAAIDSAAEELDDEPHAAVAIEVSRSFRLRNSLYMEPQGIGLWRDAAIGGVRVLMGRVAEQARPSADAKPAN